ncbi:hypothetical protein P7K49_030104, partial [Saguinus oedipus]
MSGTAEYEAGASSRGSELLCAGTTGGSHIENRGTLEIHVHVLLIVPTFLVTLVLTIEVWVPDQQLLWVLRTWMGLVPSKWTLQLRVL